MIGLDTNVVLRYLLQDDRAQSAAATRLIESLTPANPGFISIATTLEIFWVLRSSFRLTPVQIAEQIEMLLRVNSFAVQNEQQVFEAMFALKNGLGEFEDALIGSLNAWAGASQTLTFDTGTSRLTHFRILS
jgi:predicted nucleic-acid-binding protein